jgi:hypothetical protein
VSSKSETAIRPVAFVISPIGQFGSEVRRKADLTLKYIIKAALEPDYVVVRADHEESPDSISTKMIERIVEAQLVVADLTDHNPNVFYELAVAHSFGRPVVHLIDATQEPPFDVVDQRVIKYDIRDFDSVAAARASVVSASAAVTSAGYEVKNPISTYGTFAAIAKGEQAGAESLSDVLGELSGAVRRIERQLSKVSYQAHPRTPKIWELGARGDLGTRGEGVERESMTGAEFLKYASKLAQDADNIT